VTDRPYSRYRADTDVNQSINQVIKSIQNTEIIEHQGLEVLTGVHVQYESQAYNMH